MKQSPPQCGGDCCYRFTMSGEAGPARAAAPVLREHPEVQEKALAVLALEGAVLTGPDADAVLNKVDHVEPVGLPPHQRLDVAPVF